MKNIFKTAGLFLLSAMSVAAVQAKPAVVNDKPFVIPELKEWKGASGTFELSDDTRIAAPAALTEVAGMLAADIQKMFGVTVAVTGEKPHDGDIVLALKDDKMLGDEGYALKIGKRAELTAPTATGVYWGTRTLLQIADFRKNSGAAEGFSLPQGSVRDWPDYGLRGFMLDCGRKFIPMEYLEACAEMMSYYKMNFLQIHLNDSGFPKFFNWDWNKTYGAFRLECDTFPGLAAEDGYYTKAEFRDFQKDAAKRFVEVLPEIDVPAHTLAFVHYKPELGSKEYGDDHFDLFNPATYDFVDALFAEYLSGDDPVFVGPKVSIGTDEYSNRDPEVVEKFRYFTDRYIRYVEGFGKQACVWGSLSHARGETPVKVDDVLMHLWSNDYAKPQEMIDLGYKLISIPDKFVYIVPAAGYYKDYLDIEKLYAEWTPAHINGVVLEEKHPAIVGGMFAVWNDHVGNGISTRDIHHRMFPSLQTLAVKMWTGAEPALPFAEFDRNRLFMAEAPAVNFMGRYVHGAPAEMQCIFTAEKVTPATEYPCDAVGYDYRVTFDVDCADEALGTELFRSSDAVFYLSDPVSGMLGFARDGYLNRFGYRLHAGRKMNIAIEGDNAATRLYIDGKLVEELKRDKKWYSENATTAYVPTLVFPLHRSGDFRSSVTNLKVEQK